MYRFPSTVDVRSVAPKGCVVTDDGICHQIKPFNGKLECLDSAYDRIKHLFAMDQKSEESETGYDVWDLFKSQSQFCVECDRQSEWRVEELKCKDSVMVDKFSKWRELE